MKPKTTDAAWLRLPFGTFQRSNRGANILQDVERKLTEVSPQLASAERATARATGKGNIIMVIDTFPLNSDGLGIGNAFRRLGFRVSEFDYLRDDQKTLVEMADIQKPEIVFVTKGQGLKRETLRQVKEHSEKIVMWYPDAYLPRDKGYGHEFLAEILPEFDCALINCRGLVSSLGRYNKNCHFAPSYFDNHFFKIDEITTEDQELFGCDAVFAGNNQKTYGRERLAVLKTVSRVCKLKIWGLGWGVRLPRSLVSLAKVGLDASPRTRAVRVGIWERIVASSPPFRLSAFSKAVMGRELVDNALSKAYQCANIGLNAGTYHLPDREAIDLGFSDRLYECMGNGTPYLTPPIANIEEFFVEGEELVVYSSRQELVDKIRYLLKNDDERKRIGEKGYAKIMRYHTIDLRIQQYLDIIEGRDCPFDCKHGAT